jgi:serine/threonine-protein kinase
MLKKGDQLGPYVLDRLIGRGGMAEVWAASDPSLDGAAVALKVLDPASDSASRVMFRDEVRMAECLRHPNIVRVEGCHEHAGWMFTTMELLDGKDVRRLVTAAAKGNDRLPVPVAVRIARDAATGLAAAHDAVAPSGQRLELVHRDVSPQNIMVTRSGSVKVLDFGVARAVERETKTAKGVIKGKLAYMSPEQILGKEVTVRTDIFALGLVLWEMLAMERAYPLKRSEEELFVAVMEVAIRPIEDLRRDVSPELAALVRGLLRADPRVRPPSMHAVAAELSQILAGFGEAGSVEALAAWARPHLATPPERTVVLLSAAEATDADVTRSDGESTTADGALLATSDERSSGSMPGTSINHAPAQSAPLVPGRAPAVTLSWPVLALLFAAAIALGGLAAHACVP